MKLRYNQKYTIPNSNTYIQITKIKFRGDGYTKVSYFMGYKSNNLVIELVKNAKLMDTNITHWIKYEA